MLGAGPEKQKRGRRSPPFLAGRGSYRFLPPFFFPPFAAFFAMRFIPPFVWDSVARSRSPYRSAAARRARRRCVHTPLVASFANRGALPLGLPDTLARAPLCRL